MATYNITRHRKRIERDDRERIRTRLFLACVCVCCYCVCARAPARGSVTVRWNTRKEEKERSMYGKEKQKKIDATLFEFYSSWNTRTHIRALIIFMLRADSCWLSKFVFNQPASRELVARIIGIVLRGKTISRILILRKVIRSIVYLAVSTTVLHIWPTSILSCRKFNEQKHIIVASSTS